MKKNPLLNTNFLKELYQNRTRNVYVKIVSHNLKNEPLETLEGMVTGGSINLDGQSAVRRSCSLTFCSKENQIIHDYFWAVTTQFKMSIGIENVIDTDNYPDIIWFPMGWYLISSFSYSKTPNAYTINISGKDKMCMLNGELGGVFTSLSTDLGKIDQIQEDGSIITKDRTIKEIIFDLVHTFGQEQNQNIIINDLDLSGSSLMTYSGSSPLYLLFNTDTQLCVQYTTDPHVLVAPVAMGQIVELSDNSIIHDQINQIDEIKSIPTEFYLVRNNQIITDIKYVSTRVEHGETIGYKPTEVTFAGALVMNAGETVTGALDKIKNALSGYYEYFYNTDGQFVFQLKRTSLTTRLSNLREDSEGVNYIEPAVLHTQYTYNFDNNELLTQLSNTLQLNNLKNDFTVWGKNGNKAIHMRYAIDTIPHHYCNYDGEEFATALELYSNNWLNILNTKAEKPKIYNWREILYQMAIDDKKRTQKDDNNRLKYPDFREKLIEHNPQFFTGYTGYEQYYLDIEGFWRDNYHPVPPKEYFERAYNETTPNKQVYDYQRVISKEQFLKEKIDWSKVYTFDDADDLTLWFDLQNIIEINPLLSHNDNYFYSFEDIEKNSIMQMQNPKGYNNAQEVLPTDYDYKDRFLNSLYFKGQIGYKRLIDAIDYTQEQIYVKIPNPDYTESTKDTEPPTIFVQIFDALTPEMKEKVYVSTYNDGATAKRYEDFFLVETYKEANINFVDQYAYIKAQENDKYYPIRDMFLTFEGKEPILIWSSASAEKVNTETANIFLAASKTHGAKLSYILEGEMEMEYFNKSDKYESAIYIKGRRAITTPYWWYKGSETSEGVEYLSNKILSDFYTTADDKNLFCKYNDIYLQRLGAPEGEVKEVYYSPLEVIDINKLELYFRIDVYDDKNTISSSEFTSLTSYINPALISDTEVERFYLKLEEKIDIILKAKEEKFHTIYFTVDKETQNCNENIQKFMYHYKRDLYGNKHLLFMENKIKTLILYWELYYNYLLPIEKEEYLDCSNCWQSELYKDFNKASFWIDILDSTGEISNNSVKKIGIRPKVENNNTATALSFGDTPNIQWVTTMPEADKRSSGYKYILLTEAVEKLIVEGHQGTSCKDVIDEWLNKYALISNTLSFSTIPIYHLEPNTEVFLNSKDLNVYGGYELNRITIPLNYNGIMQLSVTKIMQNIV